MTWDDIYEEYQMLDKIMFDKERERIEKCPSRKTNAQCDFCAYRSYYIVKNGWL